MQREQHVATAAEGVSATYSNGSYQQHGMVQKKFITARHFATLITTGIVEYAIPSPSSFHSISFQILQKLTAESIYAAIKPLLHLTIHY